ncbi:sensor histidine kinase [candidate division KSB1 bacterium]|nr:sensor histidine kinase [candidate division KSB1 bacterium]
MKNQKKNTDNIWIFSIGLLIILVAVLHYSTPTHLHQLHELFRAFFYLPIILAAFRFQLKGGIISSTAIIIIYFPHVVFQWGGDFLHNFSRFLEMIMYLFIGTVAGYLALREKREREKYQRVASELQESYQQLKAKSDKIVEIEDQLRTSERLAVMGELAASLAHEVRNPLGSIWGVVEILKEDNKKTGENSEFLDVLVKEVKRLNQVVENYSNFARKPELYFKSCNLQEVVQSVVYLLNHKAQKQNVQLNVDFPNKPIFVTADEGQIQQTLINLILNSISAITGSGSVIVKGDYIELGKKKTVTLSVIDSGQGIARNVVGKIFNPFFTTKKDGTGLGLSIVKRIVEQNKWKIEINSTSSKGTVVTVYFSLEKNNGQRI